MKHEAVKDTGSFKVRFQNGRPSKFFYWNDVPSRRLHPDMLTSETGAGAGVRLGRTGQGITFTGAFNARGSMRASRWFCIHVYWNGLS